jgi:MraZ protein
MVFTGTFEHAIDAKHRLAVPAEVRNAMLEELEEGRPDGTSPAADEKKKKPGLRVVVTPTEDAQGLSIYTKKRFQQRSEELENSELDVDDLLEYERAFYSLTHEVEIDAQGRIRLPEMLLSMTPLQSEVVLIGVKDHLEIRDRAAWKTKLEEILRTSRHLLMNPRRAMKQRSRRDESET